MASVKSKISIGIYIVLILSFFTSCNQTGTGLLIITRTTSTLENPDFITGESWRYLPGSSIIAIKNGEKAGKPELLTSEFSSACSPSISYDGEKMLFAGQKLKDDKWQIWEMNLKNRKYRKVTELETDCIDPAYLPGNRILFSKKSVSDTTGCLHQIYTCKINGSDIQQITYHPHSNYASTVLNDGRILTLTRQTYPDVMEQYLMVLRPDGTKADRFYPESMNGEVLNSVCETNDGRLVFVCKGNGLSENCDIYSISTSRPVNSRKNLTDNTNGNFYSATKLSDNTLLVSHRPDGEMVYSLCTFDLDKNNLVEVLYREEGYNVTGAVLAIKYERPKHLPSEVDMLVKTGQILCQDVNLLGDEITKHLKNVTQVRKIEVLGLRSSLGTVPVEEDGSFYLKPLADIPFRLQAIDEAGNTIYGPSGWMWLRPNERRGCVGCHEDPELAPENRLSMAVGKMPVIIPVHLDEIKEKSVDLE